MIKNRYNRIPHPDPNTTRERDTYNLDGINLKTVRVKSQEDSYIPTDGHKAILIKLNCKSNTNRKRTNIDNLNNPQQKHRIGTISNKLLRGGGGRGEGVLLSRHLQIHEINNSFTELIVRDIRLNV